jgi:hypothetical protein
MVQVGPAMEEGVKMGPIVSRNQYEKVVGFIERAKAQGATVAAGGYKPQVRLQLQPGPASMSDVLCQYLGQEAISGLAVMPRLAPPW